MLKPYDVLVPAGADGADSRAGDPAGRGDASGILTTAGHSASAVTPFTGSCGPGATSRVVADGLTHPDVATIVVQQWRAGAPAQLGGGGQ